MAAIRFVVPDGDFGAYLRGTWKRNLEWRVFGGAYQHLRVSNTVVVIEDDTAAGGGGGGGGDDIDGGGDIATSSSGSSGSSTRHLRWNFGSGVAQDELRFGYGMKFIADPKGMLMEWEHAGHKCNGVFQPATSVAILNFYMAASTVTITYRVMDADTMAVCIVEVDDKHTPTIQYGNMCRLDAAAYAKEAKQ
eukprot:g4827.t1